MLVSIQTRIVRGFPDVRFCIHLTGVFAISAYNFEVAQLGECGVRGSSYRAPLKGRVCR